MKEELIENIIMNYGDRFKIREYTVKELPDLVLHNRIYDNPMFNIFILELKDNVLDRLVDWSKYIRITSEISYILSPKNKEDEVRKYVNLMSGNILVKTYNKNEVEF